MTDIEKRIKFWIFKVYIDIIISSFIIYSGFVRESKRLY